MPSPPRAWNARGAWAADEVEEAESGSGALELLTSIGDFDVAIVDLGRANGREPSDDLSGMAAIRALRKAQPGLGIVAHGPQAQHQAATEAIRAGATAYVVKTAGGGADRARGCRHGVRAVRRPRGRLRRSPCAHPAPAPDPSALRRRPVDRAGGKAPRPHAETIRTHTKAILSRLGARDRAHAVAIALLFR